MKKRGQVTIFIVVGLVMVGLFVAIFSLGGRKMDTATLPERGVEQFVGSCLEKVGEDGAYLLGLQGGYYQVPQPSVMAFSYASPLYLMEGKSFFPDRAALEEQLSLYVEEGLGSCLHHFSSYEEQGFQVETAQLRVKTEIVPGRIRFLAEYPVTLSKGDTVASYDMFTATLPLDLYAYFEQVQTTFPLQQESAEAVPFGALTHLAYKKDYTLELDWVDDQTVLYVFLFDAGKEKPFIFSYGVRYNWGNQLTLP